MESNKTVFSKRQETIKGFKADIKLEDCVKPVFCKVRPVPYSLRQNVEEELDR